MTALNLQVSGGNSVACFRQGKQNHACLIIKVFVSSVCSSEILIVRDPNNPNAKNAQMPFQFPGVVSGSSNAPDVSKSTMLGHPALASLFAGMLHN